MMSKCCASASKQVSSLVVADGAAARSLAMRSNMHCARPGGKLASLPPSKMSSGGPSASMAGRSAEKRAAQVVAVASLQGPKPVPQPPTELMNAGSKKSDGVAPSDEMSTPGGGLGEHWLMRNER